MAGVADEARLMGSTMRGFRDKVRDWANRNLAGTESDYRRRRGEPSEDPGEKRADNAADAAELATGDGGTIVNKTQELIKHPSEVFKDIDSVTVAHPPATPTEIAHDMGHTMLSSIVGLFAGVFVRVTNHVIESPGPGEQPKDKP